MKLKLFDNPIFERPHPFGEGIQKVYRFQNNYGASVIRNKMPTYFDPSVVISSLAKAIIDTKGNPKYSSYTDNENEWELAVIKFPTKSSNSFELSYNTKITNDVIGHLTAPKVEKILEEIKKLKC